MTPVVEAALALWGLSGADCGLVAERENHVYAIRSGASRYALRLHRQGYRTADEIRSELDWMAVVAKAGIRVPEPVPARDGALLQTLDGLHVDVLTWLEGETLKATLPGRSDRERPQIFDALGQAMAGMHAATDAWPPPKGFTRAHWDTDGLLGETPLWNRFWDNPHLPPSEKALADCFRTTALERLEALEPDLDDGLIHADLVPDNVLVSGTDLAFIDFDDGGFGFRLFDVATALFKHRAAPDYPALEAALIEGYRRVRPLDTGELPLFFALRAATYVGWNITRMTEPGGAERNQRFISTFRHFAQDYLS